MARALPPEIALLLPGIALREKYKARLNWSTTTLTTPGSEESPMESGVLNVRTSGESVKRLEIERRAKRAHAGVYVMRVSYHDLIAS